MMSRKGETRLGRTVWEHCIEEGVLGLRTRVPWGFKSLRSSDIALLAQDWNQLWGSAVETNTHLSTSGGLENDAWASQ